MPKEPDVHLVMDNYATHKTPKVKAWLARRPHWHVRFTPTSDTRLLDQRDRAGFAAGSRAGSPPAKTRPIKKASLAMDQSGIKTHIKPLLGNISNRTTR